MNSNEFNFKALSMDELHSACIIDECGREIPITHEMIESACGSLADTFRVPRIAQTN